MSPVFVRARDGALYREPLWVFPEGFICFDESEPAELVLWSGLPPALAPEAGPVQDAAWLLAARVALRRVFGFGAADDACSAAVETLAFQGEAQRVIPGGVELAPARSYFFEMAGHRPPRPTIAEGTERYASRAHGTVFDWAPRGLDVTALEIPEVGPG